MKLLLFVCFLAFAAAEDFLQKAEPAIDEAILSFYQGAVQAGSLSKAMGIDDPEIEQMADDAGTELGRLIRETLKEMLEKIKDNVDSGKAVGYELIEKVKELQHKLKDLGEEKGEKAKEMLKHIREKAREILKGLIERLGLGKRNMDDSFDQMARFKFRDLIEKIKEKILSEDNIQKIRNYIREHFGDSPLVKKLQELVKGLSQKHLREIISIFLDSQSGQPLSSELARSESWDKVKNFFKGLNIKINDHSKKFGQWVKDRWGKGIDKLRSTYGTIKAIAMEFMAHASEMNKEMGREAMLFFQPYEGDLGTMWTPVVNTIQEIIEKNPH